MKLKSLLPISLAVAGLTFGSARADQAPSTFVRAEIHGVQWNIRTTIAVSLDAVRASTSYSATLGSEGEVSGLVSVLDVAHLHSPPSRGGAIDGDFRLVIDLVRKDGTKESFAADNAKLIRLSDGASRPIDRAFKQRFSFAPVP